MLPDLLAGSLGFVGVIALSAVVAGVLLNRGRVAASVSTKLLVGSVLGLGVTVTEYFPVGSTDFGQLDAVPAGVLASAAFGGITAAAATALIAEGGLLLKGDVDPWSRLAPLLALVVGVALARVNRVKPPSPAELAAPVVPAINALRLRLVSLPEGRWRAVGMLVAATCLFGAFHLLVPAVDAAGGAAFYLLLNLLSLAVILVILGHFSALTVDDLGNLLAAGPLQTSPAGAPVGQVGLPGMGGQPLAREGGAGLPSGIDPLVAGFADPAGPRIIETLQPVVLRKMLAESVAAGQLDWLDAGLEGDVVIDRDLDRTVLAVPAHLRTAVEGMIALAIADSDDGALRVTARAGLEAPEDHLQLILTVSDEGRGTAEGDRAAAGPLAGRGDAAAEGGLAGIAPYRFLVEQMGGTLRSVSVPGVGTTARLELTLRHAAATPLPESAGA